MNTPDQEPNVDRRIVLVGHCTPDEFLLRSAIGRVLPRASIESATDADTLATLLEKPAVALVNRVLDGRFESDSGLELIQALARDEVDVVPILISNLAEAQEQAIAAGAARGFGKSELYSDETRAILEAAAVRR